MRSLVRLIPIVAACSVSIAASQHAPAERTLQESLYDLTGDIYYFPCSEDGEPLPVTDGEPIRIEGQLYERISLLLDAAGEYHYSLNTMPVGMRGTSEISGEEFRVSENSQAIANQRLAGGTGTYQQDLKLVGKDTHRVFWLVVKGNYVITADGEVLVSRHLDRVECTV